MGKLFLKILKGIGAIISLVFAACCFLGLLFIFYPIAMLCGLILVYIMGCEICKKIK